MYKIKTLNKIAECGLKLFPKDYMISDTEENPDAIVLRSFSMHEMDLPKNLLAVGRAGAGVNNIPIDKCSEEGIVVFNTPGANANAVKELTVLGLLLSSRNVSGGIEWAKTLRGTEGVAKQVEKGKSAFAGPEIEGKKIAIIGLGAIGVMVANTVFHLGMKVIGYDPYISVKSALGLSRHVEFSDDLKSVLEDADYISIHVPLIPQTKGMINAETIGYMKDGARLLNFSRGELVDFDAVKGALESGKIAKYVTDFPDEKILEVQNVIAIPHLGASTPESEDNCAKWAVKEITNYLRDGNITNSVNFPNCECPREGVRICVAHRNIPNTLSGFSTILANEGINIENMVNKSKKDYAYTIIDIALAPSDDIIEKFKAIEGVLRVRVIL